MSDSKIWPEGAGQLNLRQGHIDHRDKSLDIAQRLRFLVGEGIGQDAAREIDTLRAEVEKWRAQHARDSRELRALCGARDEARESAQSSKERAEKSESALVTAEDGWHMANGVADLAMKHRDLAESALAECREDAERYHTVRDLILRDPTAPMNVHERVLYRLIRIDCAKKGTWDAAIDAARAK